MADYESAGEWTDRASDFCDANALTAFPGMCRVNHAEVMKVLQLPDVRDEVVALCSKHTPYPSA